MSVNFDNFNSIISLFHHQAKTLKDSDYLWKKSDGKFLSQTWDEVRKSVESIATGL